MSAKNIIQASIAAVALAAPLLSQGATLIYSQNFSLGNNTTSLNGTTSTTGGGTWVGNNTAIKTDGSVLTSGYNYLSWTPTAGFVYTLSVNMDTTGTTSGQWLAMGFNLANTNIYTPNTAPWVLVTDAGNVTPTAGGSARTSTTVTAGSNNSYSIELDTRPTLWVSTFKVNGSQFAQYTYVANPSIGYVGLQAATPGNYNGVFQVTSVVPEPSSFVLLSLAAAAGGALFLRRHRRASR